MPVKRERRGEEGGGKEASRERHFGSEGNEKEEEG